MRRGLVGTGGFAWLAEARVLGERGRELARSWRGCVNGDARCWAEAYQAERHGVHQSHMALMGVAMCDDASMLEGAI
jgi:hypothetical protein